MTRDSRWSVLRPRIVLLCLLLLAAIDASGAQAVAGRAGADDARQTRSGTWSATNGSGVALMGTWTATPDSTGSAVMGTWTLLDADGRTAAEGGWSAAKSATRWTGGWRAIVAGRPGEYAGTWTAALDVDGGRPLADLFESAVRSVVSGTWRAAGRSGGWSVRAAERESGRRGSDDRT